MQKILLVEDDNSIIRNLSYTLECEGFSVTACMTQKDALNEINNNNFDLILLDLSLPDGNGYAICSMIRRNSDIPVIFLTASDDEANIAVSYTHLDVYKRQIFYMVAKCKIILHIKMMCI